MCKPHISELPVPRKGKKGWPWDKQSDPLPSVMPDGRPWPRISVVTPNYNYGEFIEETIRSVLLQGYPNLEYIIVDGGSTDESLEIIRRYEPWISYWVSEPDNSHTEALMKAFDRAQGEIFAWINSDDYYEPDAFGCVVQEFSAHPAAAVISGVCHLKIRQQSDEIVGPSPLRTYKDFLLVGSNWMSRRQILQPEAFFRRELYTALGGFRKDLRTAFDGDFWIRAVRAGYQFHSFSRYLANLRLHPRQKTSDLYFPYLEFVNVAWEYLREDWSLFGGDALIIAEDLFKAIKVLASDQRAQYEEIIASNSYKLTRRFARLRFW